MDMAATVTADRVSNGRGGLVPSSSLTHLAAGTMVSRDLAAARRLYEGFFGMECVRYAPDRMLVRDRRAKYLMKQGARDFFVIDVREVEMIGNPQRNLNHWGFSVQSTDEVDRIHAKAKAEMEGWWIRKVRPITKLHGSYGFYLIDNDDNWWEVEYRNGMTNDGFFSQGDHDTRTNDDAMKVDPPLLLSPTPSDILGPDGFMTHGTTDVVDVGLARHFYEDVLGLRSVQHYPIAQFTAGGGDFAIVGVQTGSQTAYQDPTNRWILLVDDREDLDRVRERALAGRERFKVREIGEIGPGDDGGEAFLVRSADDNWFEISTRPRADYTRIFERGDVAPS